MAGKILFKIYLESTMFLERYGGDINFSMIILRSILLVNKNILKAFFFLTQVYLKTKAQLSDLEKKTTNQK